MVSLRRVVLERTGQDLRRCQTCRYCDDHVAEDADIPLSGLVQLVLLNDDEVLTCRTLWSETTLENSLHSCHSGFNLTAIILALRNEAVARGILPQFESNKSPHQGDKHEISHHG